jgi:tetratricopeptide (TPR) repeat protein
MYTSLAELYRDQEEYERAKRFATWATELWEGNGFAYFILARLAETDSMRTVLFSRAVEAFQVQVKHGSIDSKNPLALALVILASRRLDAADGLHYLLTSHVLASNDLTTKMISGLLDEAYAEAAESLTYNENLVDAAALQIIIGAKRFLFNQQIHKASATGDMSHFIDLARDLCKKFPQSVTSLEALSTVLQLNHANDEAIKYLTTAVEIEPFNVRLFIERAQIEVETGDCAGARADLKQAVSFAGKDAADFDFKTLTDFGSHNNCAALGVQ